MRILALLTMVFPFCAVDAQNLDPAMLVGRWSGSGTFFDAELQKRVGTLPFALQIAPDNSGTGQVGSATLQDVHVNPTRPYIEVRARLAHPVAADPALAKERLVLVVTALSDSTIDAEFHLKSSVIYDLTMREGRVLLTRVR